MKNSVQKWGQTISQSSFLPCWRTLGKLGIHLATSLNTKFQSTIKDLFWMAPYWRYEKPIWGGRHRENGLWYTQQGWKQSSLEMEKLHQNTFSCTQCLAGDFLCHSSDGSPQWTWFNGFIFTLILVLTFEWKTATFISVMVDFIDTCMLRTGETNRNVPWKSRSTIAFSSCCASVY